MHMAGPYRYASSGQFMSKRRKYARRAAGAALLGGAGTLAATKRGRRATGNWAQLSRYAGAKLRSRAGALKRGGRAMSLLRGLRKAA